MTESLPRESPTAFAATMLGILPHSTQAEFLECRAPTKVACAGRRWGKSMAGAIDALWWAVTRPGTVQFVIAPTADQAGIIWRQALTLAQGSPLSGLVTKAVESPFAELRLATRGSEGHEVESAILARSSSHDAKYLRGHGADRVIVDECAFVGDMVLAQTVPPMLTASPYRELVLISTPFGTGSYFHRAFERGQQGDPSIRSFHYPSWRNPRLSREYLEQQRAELSQVAFETEYAALFLDSQASVFSYQTIQAAIDQSVRPGPINGHRYVIGFDPAKYADRSGVAVVDVTERPYRAVEILDLAGLSYLEQAGRIRRVSDSYNRAPVLLDSTAHDQMLEELERQGVRAEGYRFSNQSKRELIERLTVVLERGELRLPNHAALLKELQYYRFETLPSGTVKLGAPAGSGHYDDLVTALALAAWQANESAGLPFGWLLNDPEWRAAHLSPMPVGGEPEARHPGWQAPDRPLAWHGADSAWCSQRAPTESGPDLTTGQQWSQEEQRRLRRLADRWE